jgi:RNA polymerase sigma-70 factor (TIGR02957 family)
VVSQAEFRAHRPLLKGIAYRMLGEVTEAEDVVQDAWLRWSDVDADTIMNPRAYLVRITTRLAIDRLRRAKARRETYIGPWLPEPLRTDGDASTAVELADAVSTAMLVVLETLSPLERTVFVLREAFAVPYREIAEILERREDTVRQLARRAREHVRQRTVRFDVDVAVRREVTERFLAAATGGDIDALLAVLAPDVTLVADSGGLVQAPRRPAHGAVAVAHVLIRGVARFPTELSGEVVEINGGPGIAVASGGVVIATITLQTTGGLVQRIEVVANPHKLAGVRDHR